MNYKIIEENSTRLSIRINNYKELIISIAFTVTGILVPILSLLGITEKIILASDAKISKDSLYSLLIFGYMVSIYALAQGVYGLTSPIDSTFSFDKARQKVTLQVRKLFSSKYQEVALSEVTGVEELSPKNISELVIWLGKTERVRGCKIVLARVSGYGAKFLKVKRKISDFLKDQPIQLLDKEWTIRQSEDMFAVYNMYRNSNRRFYSVKKREKILIYEPDGKEQSRHNISKIVDVQVEENPDKSDEPSDRIILVMKSGEKEPISNYQYSFTAGHDIVVRALRYNLGLQSWLHFSPDM